MAEIHVGRMIRDRVEQRGTSVSWFARQLCCERTNIYSIYRRSSVDTALLAKISCILEYDFFAEISRELTFIQHNVEKPNTDDLR